MDRAFAVGGAGTFLAICARDVDSFSFRVVQGSSFGLFLPYGYIVEFNDH